jgi:putative effector of murein hydrolase LrgA (UPF0299 family)
LQKKRRSHSKEVRTAFLFVPDGSGVNVHMNVIVTDGVRFFADDFRMAIVVIMVRAIVLVHDATGERNQGATGEKQGGDQNALHNQLLQSV